MVEAAWPGGQGLMGWFGKLPAVGDFAARGLPHALQDSVHHWVSDGMSYLTHERPDEWREWYLVSPVWHFVMNAGVWSDNALVGCLAPSVDKVGRCSPLLAMRSFEGSRVAEVLPPASAWLYRVDALIRRVVGERMGVDTVLPALQRELMAEIPTAEEASSAGRILAELGIVDDGASGKAWFSWPDLADVFVLRRDRSFWWAEPSPKQPPRQVVHSGAPDSILFGLLLGGDGQV